VYLNHFNLTRNPFDQLPDPEFLFLTEQHKEALARMQFALAINDSFAIVTGEVGSGKTTLVRKLLTDLAEECTPAFITHTRLSDIELLQMIMLELGVKPFKMGKVRMLDELRRIVGKELENGRRIVIVIDEAQNFAAPILEELRLLTCLDTDKTKSISIILVGQPQLSNTLESPDLDQLRQRCRLRFHLDALSDDETLEYIRHRIAVAGGDADQIFDEAAIASIYGLTRGIPRLVNSLCDTAMIMAYVAKRDRVTSESIDDALSELNWTESTIPRDTLGSDEVGAGSVGSLTITQNGVLCSKHRLNMPSYIIGRSDECSVVLHDKYLSRHHALLAHSPAGWTISDLNSTNGITVNGRAVKIAKLKSGDVIGIGTYEMRLTLDGSAQQISGPDDSTGLYTELPDLAAS
jgi:general secretion pathway protein A